ncbi:putative cyclin-D7-1 [Rutidosis leptorrhynchoides]|uniref:putative cyclin-D7-1 n=1 Tax=Rutidosis leptorrhynchoides TaxID=125765 RepID=UPI003A99EF21
MAHLITPCNVLNNHKNGFSMDDTNDQFLMCDEVWDMSPVTSYGSYNDAYEYDHHMHRKNNHIDDNSIHPITKHEVEHWFDTCLRKELKYMAGSEFVNILESNRFVSNCRMKAFQWFIQSQRRFNCCMGTVFKGMNYLDRFIDSNQCNGWSNWMMELLSLGCLSIALKFGETCPPSLHEIQDGLEYNYEPRLVQKMEMKILKVLRWELNSITPHTYVELINWELKSILKPLVLDDLSSRFNDVVLASSLDVKMLRYRPSVIAMSGLKCVVVKDQEYCLSHITSFIPTGQEKNLQSCYKTMQEILVRSHKLEANGNPSSPDTVLAKEPVTIREQQVDLCFIDGPATDMMNKLKRKRYGDQDEWVVNHKKCVN